MEDFEEKLNSILSSPETMSQIMALANSLSGESAGAAQTAPQESPPVESAPNAPSASSASSASSTQPARGGSPLELLQGLDPKMLQRILSLWGEYNRAGDEKAALLQAMRPFLREERRSRLDKAVQITRITRVIRVAMEQFKGGEGV